MGVRIISKLDKLALVSSLGIMGDKMRATLRPLNTIVL